ncbi:hypothetical protein GCM10011611_25280 [Aliidongia dinghuensis]|uniref:Uncharacterized protein n=1 Tax=Aliidongia dinghuensis TaxID=1867774 RepID=A0A8J2YT86_9PROT|nr:hypothetical protein [Aliidongia dinghuensis]GGF18333.1 hypothetical protein GCM10011611_25280 [Aliidongia dinghuensis]
MNQSDTRSAPRTANRTANRTATPRRRIATLALLFLLGAAPLAGCADIHPATGLHTPPGRAR